MAKSCTGCGKPFYTREHRTTCQRCAGDVPDTTTRKAAERAATTAANTQPQTDTQTVDIKSLTKDGSTQTADPKPSRRGRKTKDAADDAG